MDRSIISIAASDGKGAIRSVSLESSTQYFQGRKSKRIERWIPNRTKVPPRFSNSFLKRTACFSVLPLRRRKLIVAEVKNERRRENQEKSRPTAFKRLNLKLRKRIWDGGVVPEGFARSGRRGIFARIPGCSGLISMFSSDFMQIKFFDRGSPIRFSSYQNGGKGPRGQNRKILKAREARLRLRRTCFR